MVVQLLLFVLSYGSSCFFTHTVVVAGARFADTEHGIQMHNKPKNIRSTRIGRKKQEKQPAIVDRVQRLS